MANLSPACEARFHLEAADVERDLFTELADKHGAFRARTHHAHVAFQNTKNLRKFINACLAQEATDSLDRIRKLKEEIEDMEEILKSDKLNDNKDETKAEYVNKRLIEIEQLIVKIIE